MNGVSGVASVAFLLAFVAFVRSDAQPDATARLNNLITTLETEKDDAKRLILVKQLANLKSPKAIATLSVELSNEKNHISTRIEALKGLEALKHAEANDAIALSALKSDSDVVRARAIDGIGNLRIREFVPACIRGLSNDKAVVRRSSIDALIQFNELHLSARTLPLLKDADKSVAASARHGVALFAVKLSLFVLRLG